MPERIVQPAGASLFVPHGSHWGAEPPTLRAPSVVAPVDRAYGRLDAMKICDKCGASYEGRANRCPLDRARLREVDDPLLGRTIAGAYLVEAKIGQGAIGTVYRARTAGRQGSLAVALKVLSPEMASDARMRERFLREARAAQRIRHPNVVELIDAGETGDALVFLVMTLAPGITLAQALGGRRMPVGEAVDIGAQLADALHCAHGLGIVHRDVKPANILVERTTQGGASWSTRLVDFGLASIHGERRLTATGELIGSPYYMAPEQIEAKPPTPANDVYSLGCVLFEAFTGRPPFTGSTARVLDGHVSDPPPRPSSIEPSLPSFCDDLVFSMLGKGSADRPRAGDVAAAFRVRSAPVVAE